MCFPCVSLRRRKPFPCVDASLSLRFLAFFLCVSLRRRKLFLTFRCVFLAFPCVDASFSLRFLAFPFVSLRRRKLFQTATLRWKKNYFETHEPIHKHTWHSLLHSRSHTHTPLAEHFPSAGGLYKLSTPKSPIHTSISDVWSYCMNTTSEYKMIGLISWYTLI